MSSEQASALKEQQELIKSSSQGINYISGKQIMEEKFKKYGNIISDGEGEGSDYDNKISSEYQNQKLSLDVND